jgi:hypothetical protein
MLDISAAAAKARARRFATSFESESGPAGTAKTRKDPTRLTDRQADALKGFGLKYLPTEQRDPHRFSVLNRLSGTVGDAALRAAMVTAAVEVSGFSYERLVALGLGSKNNATRNPHTKEMSRPPLP